MKKPITPFPTAGYYGPTYFCNREEETQRLLQNIQSGQSTTLTAIRRMGKTGLIMHLQQHLPKPWKMLYLDILFTENRLQLLHALVNAIAQAIPEKQAAGKRMWDFLKTMRPVISYDSLTGTPQISLNLQASEAPHNLADLLKLLDEYPDPVIIAIDEFQQILNYPESQTDAWLRGMVQHLNNVVFVYAGSQQHLMNEIFTNPTRPFYRSTQLIALGRIPKGEYAPFITQLLKANQRDMDGQALNGLLEYTRLHTYYVQLMMSRCFIRPEKKLTQQSWHEEADKLLVEQQSIFFGYRDMLTKGQWALLKAIAAEGNVVEPSSRRFLEKHQLGTSATVLRSLRALMDKKLVYFDYHADGQKYFGVYDLLFERWIQRKPQI